MSISNPNSYSPLPIEVSKKTETTQKVFYSFHKNQTPDLAFLLNESKDLPSSYDIIYNRFTLSQLHLYFFIKLGLFKFLNAYLDYPYLNSRNTDFLKSSLVELKKSHNSFEHFILQLPEGEKTLAAKERTLSFNDPQIENNKELSKLLINLDDMLSKIIDSIRNKENLSILPYQDESKNNLHSFGFYTKNQDYFYLKNKNCYGAFIDLKMEKTLFHRNLNRMLTQMNNEFKTFPFVSKLIVPSIQNYYSKNVVCLFNETNYIINYNNRYFLSPQNKLFKKPIETHISNDSKLLSSAWIKNLDFYSLGHKKNLVKRNKNDDDVKKLLKNDIKEIFHILEQMSKEEFQDNL